MSTRHVFLVVVVIVTGFLGQLTGQEAAGRWSEQAAKDWYSKQPWLVGSNYIPKDAINELEMWQAETFNPAQIDQELEWAEGIGMNTMRVFLHNLLWQQDPSGFKKRIDRFLTIATKHQIRPIFVLFDSCWDPAPRLGPQPPPVPGVHNSGWVQSPGAAALTDKSQYLRLEAYVKGVVGAFANDPRVLAWDVWNEPDNSGGGSYNGEQLAQEKTRIAELLPEIFAWARARHPIQPRAAVGSGHPATISPGQRHRRPAVGPHRQRRIVIARRAHILPPPVMQVHFPTPDAGERVFADRRSGARQQRNQ